ncbi:MAG: flavin reductase domain protein FMN-binding [Acidobacteria bacterium]|jgi:flavin reductase (DIM6/NTAB) family NADH-FMN oxidoreductase RutF|nr:flavin reductase domain protein FMN-binding [Acidobacteriota bacterium]
MSISKEEFRRALSRFASGVTVVTTKDNDGKLFGITVSAFCSVSLEPPLVLICIEKSAGSHHAFEQSRAFVVNILGENQQTISNHFASHSDDKFSGISYRSGIENLPVLEDALTNLECRLRYSHEGGDHTIYVGEIEKATINDGNPLLYFQGNYQKLDG